MQSTKNQLTGLKHSFSGVSLVHFYGGLTFGIGLGEKIGSGKIVLDVRYDLGLTNVAEGMEEGESVKSKTWLFMLGYYF